MLGKGPQDMGKDTVSGLHGDGLRMTSYTLHPRTIKSPRFPCVPREGQNKQPIPNCCSLEIIEFKLILKIKREFLILTEYVTTNSTV